MKELSRLEIATCKRTAASVKSWRNQLAKKVVKRDELNSEIESLQRTIDKFEAPIVELTGGFTSEQVLNGEMEASMKEVTIETPVELNGEVIHINLDAEGNVINSEVSNTTVDNSIEDSVEPLPFEI